MEEKFNMFEHFGMRDVFSSLKKYKVIILIVILLSLVFGTYKGLNKLSYQNNLSQRNSENSFNISSASYMIESKVKIDKDNVSIYKDIPSQTALALTSDFCKKYVFSKLTDIYSNEEILKNINYLGMGYENSLDLNFDFLDKLFFSYQYENTMIIKLTAESHDAQFTKTLLSLYRSYLEEEYAPIICENFDISYIDTVDQISNSEKSMVETLVEEGKDKTGFSKINQTVAQVNPKKVMLKAIAVPLIIAVALCLIVVFLITLFNPTLNRETDFLAYNVPVIGEIVVNKKTKGDEK